jgi:hypothetical protein
VRRGTARIDQGDNRAILADNVSVLGTHNLPNPLPKTIKLRNR